MGGQVCHDPLINIRNIVGKRTVEHDQVNIEGIDDIIEIIESKGLKPGKLSDVFDVKKTI